MDNDKKHYENAEWLGNMKDESSIVQEDLVISREMVKI